MGLFSIPIYFRKAPTPQEVATAFEVMTGLPVSEEAHPEPVLLVYHPAHPTLPLSFNWCTDRQWWEQAEALGSKSPPVPFPTYLASITLEAVLLNSRAYSYLCVAALAVLHRLGGVSPQPFTLPAWANHPWQDVPARSIGQHLHSLFRLEWQQAGKEE
jgi:hypothetical protein